MGNLKCAKSNPIKNKTQHGKLKSYDVKYLEEWFKKNILPVLFVKTFNSSVIVKYDIVLLL